jgi:hypothetical protein
MPYFLLLQRINIKDNGDIGLHARSGALHVPEMEAAQNSRILICGTNKPVSHLCGMAILLSECLVYRQKSHALAP